MLIKDECNGDKVKFITIIIIKNAYAFLLIFICINLIVLYMNKKLIKVDKKENIILIYLKKMKKERIMQEYVVD